MAHHREEEWVFVENLKWEQGKKCSLSIGENATLPQVYKCLKAAFM